MKPNRLLGRTGGFAVAAAAIALAVSACSSSGGGGTTSAAAGSTARWRRRVNVKRGGAKPAIVMGDKNFAEEYILGNLYSQALQAKGYKVTLKENLGSSEIADKALTSGQIQILPEYTGVIYTELAHLGDRPKTKEITYTGAKGYEAGARPDHPEPHAVPGRRWRGDDQGLRTQHHLKTIGDLKNVGSFTYVAPPENATRFQGVVGLKQVYHLTNLQFKPLTIGSQYQALDQGKADSIAIFTTDGQLASGKYAVLTDTAGIFGFQQVVPVINKTLLAESPEIATILNAVSAQADDAGDHRDEQRGPDRPEEAGRCGRGVPEGQRPVLSATLSGRPGLVARPAGSFNPARRAAGASIRPRSAGRRSPTRAGRRRRWTAGRRRSPPARCAG